MPKSAGPLVPVSAFVRCVVFAGGAVVQFLLNNVLFCAIGRLAVMTETLWTEKGLVSESAICV